VVGGDGGWERRCVVDRGGKRVVGCVCGRGGGAPPGARGCVVRLKPQSASYDDRATSPPPLTG